MKRYFLPLSIALNVFLASWILIKHYHALKAGQADVSKDSMVTFTFNKFKVFQDREAFFKANKITSNDVVFAGHSLIANFQLTDMMSHIKNRGVTGENTADLLKRLDDIVIGKPAEIFVMEGINDIGQQVPEQKILDNFKQIITRVKNQSPQTKIHVYSILPVLDTTLIPVIKRYNTKIKSLCSAQNVEYIDLFAAFYNGKTIRPDLTLDGIHLSTKGYVTWYGTLDKYINQWRASTQKGIKHQVVL